MNTQLLTASQVDWLKAALALGSSHDDASNRLDMQGFDGVMFITSIEDCVNTGVATLTVEENSADSDTGMTAVTGASASATSASDDDLNGQLLVVDVYKPRERYVQGVRTSSVANIAFGSVIAVRYKARKSPTSQSSTTVAASTQVVGS